MTPILMTGRLDALRERAARTRGYALLKELRRAPERVLHPYRRRAALRSLRGRDRPLTVLFVCYGNICRSPYAAAAFSRALSPGGAPIRSLSAGFAGPDRRAPAEGIAVAARRGIDLTEHRSVLLAREAVRTAGLVVVMSEEQRYAIHRDFGRDARDVLVLGDLDPLPIDTRTLRDPWRQPAAVFEESYDRIDRCVRELARAIDAADAQA